MNDWRDTLLSIGLFAMCAATTLAIVIGIIYFLATGGMP